MKTSHFCLLLGLEIEPHRKRGDTSGGGKEKPMTAQELGKVSQVVGDGAEAGIAWKSAVLTAG